MYIRYMDRKCIADGSTCRHVAKHFDTTGACVDMLVHTYVLIWQRKEEDPPTSSCLHSIREQKERKRNQKMFFFTASGGCKETCG